MSDTETHELADELAAFRRMVPLMRWVLGSAAAMVGASFALGTWVATLEWRVQDYAGTARAVHEIQRWQATATSSQYTAADANQLHRTIAESLNAHDRRIQRTEDALTAIQRSLDRIEKRLEID